LQHRQGARNAARAAPRLGNIFARCPVFSPSAAEIGSTRIRKNIVFQGIDCSGAFGIVLARQRPGQPLGGHPMTPIRFAGDCAALALLFAAGYVTLLVF
jgi:hypothetical protein